MNIFGSILGVVDSAVSGDPVIGTSVSIGRERCRVTEKLGEGAFGAVYKCTSNGGGVRAIKHCRGTTREQQQIIELEINVLERLKPQHPHLVGYFGHTRNGVEYYILLEFCEDNLVHIMQTISQHFDESTLLRIFHHVCMALAFVHSKDFMHRDIKPANVLLATNQKFKLCDFGSCIEWPEDKIFRSKSEIDRTTDEFERFTTPQYRSPEFVDLYQRKPLGKSFDIWSLGCLLFEMTFFQHPFPEGSKVAILGANYRIPDRTRYSKKVTKLVKILLQKDPTKRPTAEQLVSHVGDLLQGGGGTFKAKKSKSNNASPSPSPRDNNRERRSQTVSAKQMQRANLTPANNNDDFADFDADWGSPPTQPKHAPVVATQSAPASADFDFGEWDPFGSSESKSADVNVSPPQPRTVIQQAPQVKPKRPVAARRISHQHHMSDPGLVRARQGLQIQVTQPSNHSNDGWDDFPDDSVFVGHSKRPQSSPHLTHFPSADNAIQPPMESLIDQPVTMHARSQSHDDPLAIFDNSMHRSSSAPPGGLVKNPYEHLVVQLNVMGFFNRQKCLQALTATKGDVTRSVEWLLQDEQRQRMGR